MNDQTYSDRAVSREEDNSTKYPIPNTQYLIAIVSFQKPNTNSQNPIAIASNSKKTNSIAIAIGYWV
jgi:hypothetical protein